MVRALASALLMSMAFMLSAAAFADIASYEFSDQKMSQRFVGLTNVLRCPKCQNQNLADSDSIIAKDLRAQIKTLIVDGQSDEQIADFMVARYGEFILYDPPFKKDTLVLWLMPFVMLCIGAFALWFFSRKPKNQGATLTQIEQQKLAELLALKQSKDRE